MELKTRLMAQFFSSSFDRVEKYEVASQEEAVQRSLKTGQVMFFQTYEIPYVEISGERFQGEPRNRSGRNFVGVDKLLTRDEVCAEYKGEADGTHPNVYKTPADILNGLADAYAKYSADDRFLPFGHGEYDQLKAGDRAYDANGRLLWAHPVATPG